MKSDQARCCSGTTRRSFLADTGMGFTGLALSAMMFRDGIARAESRTAPDGKPHFPPKAKSVIWIFLCGGVSHVESFDPKPELERLAGQPMPASFGKVITAMGTGNNSLMGSPRKWQQYGKSGMWVSDWYPHIAQHVDDPERELAAQPLAQAGELRPVDIVPDSEHANAPAPERGARCQQRLYVFAHLFPLCNAVRRVTRPYQANIKSPLNPLT